MADLDKKSTLRILDTHVVNLIQQHYPNLYAKLSSTTITNAYFHNNRLVIEFAEASDGNELV